MSDKYLHIDAQTVKAQVASLLNDYPELAEDEVLRADVIEGETDLTKIVARAFNARQEAETMAEAIKLREKELAERRSRYERSSGAMKRLIQTLMECAHQDKITLPEATLSVTKPRESVNVIDVDQLPQGFFKTIRQADKKALNDALMAGETIPGAELALGDSGLMVRTK